MTIYKVVTHVTEYRRRTGRTEAVEHKESIVINNLDTAMRDYEAAIQSIKHTFSYSIRGVDRHGRVTVFIPHMFADGTLAYWPVDDRYIAVQEFRS